MSKEPETETIGEYFNCHMIERTSPFGGPFIGKCVKCGKEGLKPEDAMIRCAVGTTSRHIDDIFMGKESGDANT